MTVAGGLGLVHAGLAEVTATDPRSWPTAALADALRGMEAAAAALDATRALVLGAFAQAAKDAGVAHVIWSTLEDTRFRVPLDDARMPTLQGRYKVQHLDTKGEANQHFGELGVPTTLLHTSFF